MLDSMRKRKENFFYSFIILAVVIVMGFFGVSKMQGLSNTSGDGAAAWVNGEAITQREFRQMLEYKLMQYQQMLGAQYDEKLLNALQVPQKTLEELIQYKLLSQQAKTLGIRVPDFELADSIRTSPQFQKDGKFDAESYSKLPNRGIEEKQRRERLATIKLQNYLADRIRMTPQELKTAILLKDTTVNLEYAKIDLGALAPKSPATPAELEAFLKETQEADLKAHYEGHKKEFTEKAQARIRQIRVGVPFKATDQVKANAKKSIEAIAKEVTTENFETVAKAKSDDEHAKKGGNVGWVTRGNLEKPLEDALDKLTVNQVSAPVETTYGFFILQLLETKPEKVRPYEEVKTDIAQTLYKEKAKKTFTDKKLKEWEAVLAEGKPLDAELKKNKIETKKTGNFSLGQGYIPGVGQVDAMVDAVFALTKEKPIAKKLFFFQDSYYYVKLSSMELPKAAEFQKATDSTEKNIATSLQGELLTSWIKNLEKKSSIKMEMAMGGGQGQPHTEED